MQYPDNFETSAFPAGTRIAAARVVSIAVSIVLLLILFACGALLWSVRNAQISPVLVAANENPNVWRIVGAEGMRRNMRATVLLQEALIANFVKRRFYISDSMIENERMWTACDPATDCATDGNTTTGTDCALFCAATPAVFANFSNTQVPDYRYRVGQGTTWSVIPATIRILPSGWPSDMGGTWRVQFSILSNKEPPIEIVAYAKVARQMDVYPRTMGFYIADFNAYRLN